MEKYIDRSRLEAYAADFEARQSSRVAMRAVTANGLKESAKNLLLLNTIPHE